MSQEKQLSIAHLGYTSRGGAGIAMERLHRGLLRGGARSDLFLGQEAGSVPNASILSDEILAKHANFYSHSFQKMIATDASTYFTFPVSSVRPSALSKISEYDVLHLHWVSNFLSLSNIRELADFGKPLVWTAHDMALMSGGCHTLNGCQKWLSGCNSCPQLRPEYGHLAASTKSYRQALLSNRNFWIVCPSKQCADIYKKSEMIHVDRVVAIPNAVDVESFYPADRLEARKALGLGSAQKVILYSAQYATGKGLAELEQVARQICSEQSNVVFLLLGAAGKAAAISENCSVKLGHISSQEMLRMAYVASDVALVPSHEETFSNVAAEAIACGTPIVGFDVGIIPELAEIEEVARSVPKLDTASLVEAVRTALVEEKNVDRCRMTAVERFEPVKVAYQHRQLYERAIKENASMRPARATAYPDLSTQMYELMCTIIEKDVNQCLAPTHKHLKKESNKFKRECRAFQNSLSWRITKPLRVIRHLLQFVLFGFGASRANRSV